ncbi:MAG: hypothetical protein RIS43_1041 [Actinomycetota bacterium]
MSDDYALSLGGKLRSIRQQQGLSLHAVEEKSQGRWKAVVVGSYERGDRAITVSKLAELAAFYGVPVGQVLPDAVARAVNPKTIRKVVIDLEALDKAPSEAVGPLVRFVAAIQAKRGDYNGRVLTIRADDLETLALMFDEPLGELMDRLTTWSIIQPLR